MIRRYIEYGRYHRLEISRCLKLETAGLGHQPVIFLGVKSFGYDSNAYISYHICAPSGSFKYLSGQGCGSRLAVGPCDRHEPAAAYPVGDLQFSCYLHPGLSGAAYEIKFRINAWTQYHHVKITNIVRDRSKTQLQSLSCQKTQKLTVHLVSLFGILNGHISAQFEHGLQSRYA